MVSNRCKILVEDVLENLELEWYNVDLGLIETKITPCSDLIEKLKQSLKMVGLELIENKNATLNERIKNLVIEMVHNSNILSKTNFPDYLSQKLSHDYTYLSKLFSEVQGCSIDHFIIVNKIERIKELIIYNDLNLSEVAYLMNYSNVAHLSNQFKKVTGLTPTHFKRLKNKKRMLIDEIKYSIGVKTKYSL